MNIKARRFGGDYLDGATLCAYGLTEDDIGAYAAIQYGTICLGTGSTPEAALLDASQWCGEPVADDVAAHRRVGRDGDVEVVLIEMAD